MRAAILVFTLAGFTCLGFCSAPSGAGARPALPTLDYGPGFAVRPAVFDGWAADGSVVLGGPSSNPPYGNYPGGSWGHIRWSRWDADRAIGHGVVWHNDCRPSCGNGHWHREPATRVSVYRVRHGHFTRLVAKVAFAGPRRRIVFRYIGNFTPAWTW